jgi:hypothetical protein
MPLKDPVARKAYQKEQSRKHYLANREQQIASNSEYKKKRRKEWNEYKATLKCTQCGFNHPAALDFHHKDPSEKEGNLHRMISNGQFKKAEEEMKKCIVLCANCHRIHHHEEKL